MHSEAQKGEMASASASIQNINFLLEGQTSATFRSISCFKEMKRGTKLSLDRRSFAQSAAQKREMASAAASASIQNINFLLEPQLTKQG